VLITQRQKSVEGVLKINPPKCDDLDYLYFLIVAQKVFTCTEAARCQPERKSPRP
jgi:hypothetical protein